MWVWDLYLCTDLEYCRRQGGRGGEKKVSQVRKGSGGRRVLLSGCCFIIRRKRFLLRAMGGEGEDWRGRP